MKLVTAEAFQAALRGGGLRLSDSKIGIGRELTYSDRPARTVIVQFSEDDSIPFRSGVAERILVIADAWLLFPRYDALPGLGLVEVNEKSTAIEFGGEARRSLAEYLATRPMEFGEPGLDLYAVADDGQALLTWDHHTQDEGLCVQVRRVDDAARLVASLCSLGSQFEVLSKVWGDGGSDV